MDRITRYSGLKTAAKGTRMHINLVREPEARPDIEKIYSSLKNCANYLVFNDYYTVDELRLVKAQTCKMHLLCPFCASRRASKLVQKNLPKVEQVLADNPSLKPAMLTLPVKNGPDLAERNRHLLRGVNTMLQRRRDCFKGQKFTEMSKIAGGIISTEFTKNGTDDTWHPHVHIMVLLTDWIDQKALSREWHEVTGDSFIVDIRRVHPKVSGDTLDIASGLMEVCKYALKFHDLTPADTWHAYNVLRRKRLIKSFGNLYGMEMPDTLLDDPLDDLPYLERIYRYSSSSEAYDLIQLRRSEDIPLPGESGHSRSAKGLPAIAPAKARESQQSAHHRLIY